MPVRRPGDVHASFHQTLIPGTERDSLHALDGLMANQTVVRPVTVSTDTAGALEIVFALAWVLGYRYGPRLADLADHRIWGSTPAPTTGPPSSRPLLVVVDSLATRPAGRLADAGPA